jgi:1,4-alpha-glucan branching enzyme
VVLDATERVEPMQPCDGGWFEIVDEASHAGTRYLYEIDGNLRVADPASRFQPDGPERASIVIDPTAFDWPEEEFTPVPYQEAILYELHVGTFTSEGTYAAGVERLDHLKQLGVTAIELMPLSQAPGRRNWGYDGVLHYAPAQYYGTPEELKRFIVAAHERGLAVILDVVYNHFGPQGNYLPAYAPQFFSAQIKTPWGAGIDYASPGNDAARRYAIENACYWLVEYAFDGLRLDATPMIFDTRPLHLLHELRDEAERAAGRRIYLIAEDVKNEIVRRVAVYDGRWSDDTHDALHVLATHDPSEYYRPFWNKPLDRAMRTIAAEGTHLVHFMQNHDQVGNRPFGERISTLTAEPALRAALAFVLLAPAVPLLFMGEEWAASTPFLFFCDFEPGLAKRVRKGRRREFSGLAQFADPSARSKIPDPGAEKTFLRSKLRWEELREADGIEWFDYYRTLLRVRRTSIAPLLNSVENARYEIVGKTGLKASWCVGGGSLLHVDANFGDDTLDGFDDVPGSVIFTTHEAVYRDGNAPPWSVRWSIGE